MIIKIYACILVITYDLVYKAYSTCVSYKPTFVYMCPQGLRNLARPQQTCVLQTRSCIVDESSIHNVKAYNYDVRNLYYTCLWLLMESPVVLIRLLFVCLFTNVHQRMIF